MAKLETIEGVGPAISAKLEEAGIATCEALLKAGASKKGRAEIAEKSGVSEGQVLKFVNHADMMRVKGVGGEYAELLECSGVDSVPELAQRNAANLTAKMAEVNEQKKLVRSLPSESQVEDWVKQAKELDRVVTH
jgi:predicted flap endonuclease-1-like 5' DNA nuclease